MRQSPLAHGSMSSASQCACAGGVPATSRPNTYRVIHRAEHQDPCLTQPANPNPNIQTVAWLDVLSARARYGIWVNGVLPDVVPWEKVFHARGAAAMRRRSTTAAAAAEQDQVGGGVKGRRGGGGDWLCRAESARGRGARGLPRTASCIAPSQGCYTCLLLSVALSELQPHCPAANAAARPPLPPLQTSSSGAVDPDERYAVRLRGLRHPLLYGEYLIAKEGLEREVRMTGGGGSSNMSSLFGSGSGGSVSGAGVPACRRVGVWAWDV